MTPPKDDRRGVFVPLWAMEDCDGDARDAASVNAAFEALACSQFRLAEIAAGLPFESIRVREREAA